MKRWKKMIKVLSICALVSVFSAFTMTAGAETTWPDKPVTIIVPYSAGGDSDFNARALAERLSEATGQNFIVQNVAGNSGAIGSLQALSAKPDGYTMLFNHTAFTINYYSKTSDLTYDQTTFGAVCGLLENLKMVAQPSLGMTSLSEIKAYCQENPGAILYGSATGTTAIVPGLRMLEAGVDLTMVDSGGTAERMTAILGGHVDITLVPEGNARDYLVTGELVELTNDLGTDIGCPVYYQLLFPKGVDAEIVAKLNQHLEEIILNDADYAEAIMTAYQQKPFYKNAEEGKALVDNLWNTFAELAWE